MNDLYVAIEYNDREFVGIEEFKSELNGVINFQLSPKWIPACSEGAEIWIDIFVNSRIGEFLKDIFVSGIIYDIIKSTGKRYIFQPLFSALENLNTKNIELYNGLRVLKFKLKFDDCEIHIGGLNKSYNLIIPKIFEEITKLKPLFEKVFSGLKVIKIELPIRYERELEGIENQYFLDSYPEEISLDYYMNLWLVTYETDFPILMYDFKNKNLIDIYSKEIYYINSL